MSIFGKKKIMENSAKETDSVAIAGNEKKIKKDFEKTKQEFVKDKNLIDEKFIEDLIKKIGATNSDDIVKLFNNLMIFAYQNGASDIHMEPWDKYGMLRLRVDGILYDKFRLDLSIHKHLIAILKILTQMRTDEHRAPQDGKFEFETERGGVDVRVSVIPITNGEKAVLRLLSNESHQLSLEDLGFGETDLKKINSAVGKNWGMILATGPTGSGKTTTIYSVLEKLNKRTVNIATIEDPVEFEIPGVNQSQVDRVAKLSFATGLRSLLRQDPNIIMVGEIRDQETAKIAVNAAMTGHKVLSTLHTNNAATTPLRLIDMGVEPYLVSSTLICAIAQRLLRRVCPECKKVVSLTKMRAKKIYGLNNLDFLFKGKSNIRVVQPAGCIKCAGTGYKGRVGVYEVLENTPEVEKLILSRAESSEVQKAAIRGGMTTMFEDGIRKILSLETTIEEFLRVMND